MVEGLVSILVPAYNHEKFIRDLLNSILEQNYKKIEVLLCDDCSTDDTYLIAQGYKEKLEEKFERILFTQNVVNKGMCRNLNHLLQISNGEYIITVASDDFFERNAVEKYVEFFHRNPEIDAVDSNAYIVKEEAVYPLKKEHIIRNMFSKIPDFSSEGLAQRLLKTNYICSVSLMYRRKVIEQIGMYDENLTFEDWDFNIRMAERQLSIKYYDECLMCYRQVKGSKSNSNTEKGHIEYCDGKIQTLDKHAEWMNKEVYYQRQKKVLQDYLDIAETDNYENLYRYVKELMKQRQISLNE